MKRDWNAMAQGILDAVGGPENISGMTHCATRLRLNLKDDAACDDAAVKEVEGVVNTLNKAGQYQVLIGTEVPKLYEKFEPLVKGSGVEISAATKDEGESIVSQVFSAISGIFAPLLPAMAGSGILRGFVILAAQLGIIAEGTGTYTILYTLAMSVFYFLPVLLGFSAGKRFGASPYLSALLGACLLYPDFIALMGDAGNGAMTDFFGIPVVLMNYNSTVIPAILSVWVYSYLYKWLDEHVSEMLKLVVLPAISLIVMVPLTMLVIGPLGVYAGEAIAFVVKLADRAQLRVRRRAGWRRLVRAGVHGHPLGREPHHDQQHRSERLRLHLPLHLRLQLRRYRLRLRRVPQGPRPEAQELRDDRCRIDRPVRHHRAHAVRYAREEQEGLACADHRRCRRRRVPRYHEGRHHCVHLRFRHYVPGFREFRPHELRLGYGRHAHFRRRGRCSCLRLHRQGGSARLRAPDAPPLLGSFSSLEERRAYARCVNLVQIVNERVGQSIKRSSSQQVAAAILLVRYTFRKEMNEREAEWFGEVPNMIPYERQERIVECLQKSGLARISELQEELPGVSISTLRRDLKELEALGKVEHLSGGAVRLLSAVHEVSISTRSGLHGSEKEQIAQVALRFVEDGDTLYLDSGSTCTALLRLLLDRDVTIYTTDASACLIKSETRAQLIVVGGEFNYVNSSFCGSMTESILRDLYFDKAFIGTNAIDEDRGVMTPSYVEAAKKRIVRENSNKAYVLCDSSKFHQFSNVRAFGFDGVSIIAESYDEKIAQCARLITPGA